MKSRVPGWAVIFFDLLLLLAAVVLFYPRVGLPNWISPGGDMVNLMLPARDWTARWLRLGIIPLWNPMTFGGVPFVGAMQAAVFYPPNLILGAFLSPLATINLLRFVHIYLFGALTWFFLRVERGHERPAALLGAIAVAGSALVASHTDHINQLAAIAWLPALVACQWRWWKTGSRPALLAFAAVLALQLLAGHPQAVFYSLLLSAAIAIGFTIFDLRFSTLDLGSRVRKCEVPYSSPRVVSQRQLTGSRGDESSGQYQARGLQSEIVNRKSKIIWLVIAVVGGFLLASIQMVPSAETARLSRRSADDLEYQLFASMPRRCIWTLVAPHAFGGEHASFLGRTTLALALVAVGVGIARRRPYAIFWALIIVLAYVLALGGYGPFYGEGRPSPVYRAFLWLFPPVRHLRVPPRILLLATLGIAVLGAEGLNWLLRLRRWTQAARQRTALFAAWGAVAVLTFELGIFQRDQFHNRVVRHYSPEVMLSGQAEDVFRGLVHYHLGPSSEAPQTSFADYRLFRLIGLNDPDYLMDVRPDAVRNRYLRLQPNLGMMLGVTEIEGYEEGLLPPIRYFDFLNYFSRNLLCSDPDAVLLGLMNVRYLYADYNQPILSATWRPAGQIIEPTTGHRLRLYENPLWLPLVVWSDWLPAEIRLDQLRGTLSRFGQPGGRLEEKQTYGESLDRITARGYLVKAEQLQTLRAGFFEPNRIAVENPTRRGGKLLVAQNPYPGWIAQVADQRVPLKPATDFSGAMDVPPGAERFALHYRPFSFRVGAYLSGLAFGVWIALLIIQRQKGRRGSAGPATSNWKPET